MKLSIRMTIFLPVMVMLIAFPLAFWLIFSYSLDWNMNYSAKRDLEINVRAAEKILADSSFTEEEEEQELSMEDSQLFRLSSLIQSGSGETRMMVLNGHYRLLYPATFGEQAELAELYSMILSELGQEETLWQAGSSGEEVIGDSHYMIYYNTDTAADGEELRHVILYCPIHDTKAILNQVSRLILIIIGVMAVVSIVFFWFVSGSITGPVRRLSAAARGIGEKKFQRVETGATVKELCELEDEINQMQEKLSQADQAERTFFQNASHELRTPLMSISGYAQGIERGVFSDSSQAAGVILDESRRLTEVVDGILTLTRMDQQRYQLTPVEFGVRDFIETQLERLEGLAYSRQIQLVLKDGEEHRIIADAGLLERAFSNVVSNCIRYGKKSVSIETWTADGTVYIRIQDDGPGIPDEDKDFLFDRFYKGKSGNHGLGLAIAMASMEYMGGTIKAENDETSGGAAFVVSMPQDCRSFAVEEMEKT